jgi:cobalt/nickel transport system permease protein
MHMSDALVSPAVGGTFLAVSAGLIGYSCKRVKEELDERSVPLMGVMGAFVFAAQMINFAIPATGSSGHLGGGLLLAILLGPHAAFLTMVSILVVQALFFADGGLLALGCNIFNLGFFPCFFVYPIIYRRLSVAPYRRNRILGASLISAIVALELGALGVVFQTTLSGIAELPFYSFALLMLPIHLAIGAVEGAATAAVVGFVGKARPELVRGPQSPRRPISGAVQGGVIGFAVAALLLGGIVSWFASARPDGLEWAVEKVAGDDTVGASSSAHEVAAGIQETTALLPDYGFKADEGAETASGESAYSPDTGTTTAGIVGGIVTLLLTAAIGLLFHRKKRPSSRVSKETAA